MKRLATALLCACACALSAPGSASAQEAQTLVTVVTAADAQTQLMALILTAQAAQQGAQTHVLLCGPAGDLALRDAPESATAGQPPRGMSPQGLLLQIQKITGATVDVCAIYLPGRGADATALVDGVGVADPAAMATRLLDPSARALTF